MLNEEPTYHLKMTKKNPHKNDFKTSIRGTQELSSVHRLSS